MEPRLASGLWVAAYIRRLGVENIPAFVARRGQAEAGAVLVKISTLDGNARAYQRGFDFASDAQVWRELASGPDNEVEEAITRQIGYDPDLWVVEVEDRQGRHFFDAPVVP